MFIPACGNFAQLTIEHAEEEIDEHLIRVDVEDLDHRSVSQPGPELSVQEVALGVAQAFKGAGWVITDDNRRKLKSDEPLVDEMCLIDGEKLQQHMAKFGLTAAALCAKVNDTLKEKGPKKRE